MSEFTKTKYSMQENNEKLDTVNVFGVEKQNYILKGLDHQID